MKKWVLFSLVILFCALPAFAQQVDTAWVRIYGLGSTDKALDVAVDAAGNVYVTGYSIVLGPPYIAEDYATIKYYPNGDTAWVRRYNNGYHDIATSIAVDGSGNVYVTGYSYGTGPGHDYATIKYDQNGNQLWVQRYNGPGNDEDRARVIKVDDFGNVYVTGYSVGSGTSNDYATIKYDSNGNQLWVQRYNGPANSDDFATSIALDGSGNVYVAGASWGGTSMDYATIKYDSAGNQLWAQRYGPGYFGANAIAVDGSGNVYVTGSSWGTSYDYATIKYDSSGTQLWVQKYDGPVYNFDLAHGIAVDGSGNVYVTGESYGSGTLTDYATIKYDSNGTQLWVQRYGPLSSYDIANDIAVDAFGNVYVTGQSRGTFNFDYATIKYDSSGNQLWVQRYNGPGNSNDYAHAIAIDGSGNVYVTGESYGSGTSEDYATIKYWQNYPPTVVAIDSSKFFCGPDTIRFLVTATDPDPWDSVTLSGPGIPAPLKGLSPLFANVKIYVGSAATYNFVYTVADRHSSDADTATYVITMNTAPAVTTPDSSKMFCGPDTIRFRVTATDPNTGDTLTLSGPGIPSPITGLSPLSANVKLYVSSPGTYDYVYTVSDLCGAITTDTAAWVITMNTSPAVVSPDSSKMFCGPDTIRFRVTATDPNPGDSLTLSGPGIPTPIKGLSPLSANVKNYVSSPGTYDYVYNVTDKCGLSNADTATWTITMNAPPNPFSLTAPVESLLFVPFLAPFDWANATDPDPGVIKYSLYISTTPSFNPDSTFAHNNILVSQYTDTLGIGRIYWKVEAFDPCNAFTWSTETWTLLAAMRGDANADKHLTVSDVVYIINYLFKGGPLPIPEQIVGDANCDTKVTVSDVIYLINYLFKGGPPPC